MHGLSISTDGYVQSMETFIGSAEDFERNVTSLLSYAGLTPEERAEWNRLYSEIDDWRSSNPHD